VIVWLASYPRSGNTLYRMLLYQLCGLVTYSVYDDPYFEQAGVSEVVGHRLLPAPVEELARAADTYLVKTHTGPTDGSPAVFVVRDGRDVMVSLAHYSTRVDRALALTYRDALWSLVTGDMGHWGDYVTRWLDRPEPTVVVRYEDLLEDPSGEVARSLEAVGVEACPTDAALPAFDELHARWPGFFRRGKVGAWRDEMEEHYQTVFWKNHGEAMERLGYV
jgi:hypothetical protein